MSKKKSAGDKKKTRSRIGNLFLVLVLLIGLSLLLYPTVSDYYNSFHQTRAIASYDQMVTDIGDDDSEKMLEEAEAYNEKLKASGPTWLMTDEEKAEYNRLLDVSGTGIMAYIEIPSIKVKLPIYHGVDQTVLQIACGHIPGSSLPVGGEGTHVVLSGHRGLPSATLFTNLDRMVPGDTFSIHVLGRVLTYEVDQINVVLPDDLSLLTIDPDKDLVTLVTCTPYGVNTHRLLVRGHRVDLSDVEVTADAVPVDTTYVSVVLGGIILGLILLGFLIWSLGRRAGRRRAKKSKK